MVVLLRGKNVMRKVRLGASQIEISEFVFGAGSIGGVGTSTATRGSGLSTDEGLARLDEAFELGINAIDTADAYGGGESEKAVGRWLHDRQRREAVVATKGRAGQQAGRAPLRLHPVSGACITCTSGRNPTRS
jgi:aryl-alcohol dehydrogenase-like predicted oxidoreductase